MQEKKQNPEDVSLKPLVIRGIVITVLIFVAVWWVGHFMKEPAENLARWVVEELGLWGIFLAVLAADALTFPIPPDTYLLAAVASDDDPYAIVMVVGLASVMAGLLAYLVGPLFERMPLLRRRIQKFRPQGEALFEKYGTWTIVVASLTPLPFSVTCWVAGIYKMPIRNFALATLTRIPRFWLYYAMFSFGWTL